MPVIPGKKIISNNTGISFAPNPINNYLKILFSNNTTGRFSIEIKSLAGEILVHNNVDIINGFPNCINLNTASLKSGNYILSVMSSNSFNTYKIIKL